VLPSATSRTFVLVRLADPLNLLPHRMRMLDKVPAIEACKI
jgi:hypothetical protein